MNKHVYQTKNCLEQYFRFNDLFVINPNKILNNNLQMYIVYFIHTATIKLSKYLSNREATISKPYIYIDLSINLIMNLLKEISNSKLIFCTKDYNEGMYIQYGLLNVYCIIPLFISDTSKDGMQLHYDTLMEYTKLYVCSFIIDNYKMSKDEKILKEILKLIEFKIVHYLPSNIINPRNAAIKHSNINILGAPLPEKMYEYSYKLG
jgi:hypothetical protein